MKPALQRPWGLQFSSPLPGQLHAGPVLQTERHFRLSTPWTAPSGAVGLGKVASAPGLSPVQLGTGQCWAGWGEPHAQCLVGGILLGWPLLSLPPAEANRNGTVGLCAGSHYSRTLPRRKWVGMAVSQQGPKQVPSPLKGPTQSRILVPPGCSHKARLQAPLRRQGHFSKGECSLQMHDLAPGPRACHETYGLFPH